MFSDNENFAPFASGMKAEGLPPIAIETFAHYYAQLRSGHTGLIAERDIEPVTALPDAETLEPKFDRMGQEVLSKTVLLKLNGGLGTSMGLNKAKALLTVKDGLTFLDIIARQALHMKVPLVLMNSFNTQDDSLAALKAYPGLWGDIPLDFLQHKVPKVLQADLSPAISPEDPSLAWAPPGHGDIYTALVTSGMLDSLLAAGYEYAFISNADNLGAVIDSKLLGYFVASQFPFMMEVADRTEADRKGGHLARWPDGQFILRESAQVPSADRASFQDVGRHKYFNTNNLWLDLPTLKRVMVAKNFNLDLPMIRNSKTLDPRDKHSAPVYHIETAAGSAISVFSGSSAIRVPRSRFAPVKTTADLLAVRSDAYVLTDDFRIIVNRARKLGSLVVTLDPAYYQLVDRFEARFPQGVPSLVDCEQLIVNGDVVFGRGVTLRGVVQLTNQSTAPHVIDDGTILESLKSET